MTYQPLTNPIECPECRGLMFTVTQRPYMTGSFPPCALCSGLGKVSGPVPARNDLTGLAAYDQAARPEGPRTAPDEPQGLKAAADAPKGLARVEAELEVAEGAIESARHALWSRAVSGNEFAEIMPVLNLLQETLKLARLNLEITKGRKGGKL